MFGTNDDNKVSGYNAKATQSFTVTKTKTSFPSELELDMNGNVKTYGGLILVKMNLKDKNKNRFEGKIKLSYKTVSGEVENEEYQICY